MTTNLHPESVYITPAELGALCRLIMVSDPSPISRADDERVRNFASLAARRLGFTDWVDAYHQLEES